MPGAARQCRGACGVIDVKRLLSETLRRRELGLAFLIVAIFSGVGFVDPRFVSWNIVQDLLVRAAPTAIVACGVMLVIVTSEIDISVGSLMALCAALMGLMISRHQWNWPMY